MSLVATLLVLAVVYFDPGGSKPPEGVEGMSTNEMLALMTRSEMSPVEAEAIANAKQRAYEQQLKAERAAREKAKREARVRAKASAEVARARAEAQARARASRSAAALARVNTSPAQNKALGRQMNALKGWSGCWSSLETMWHRESGWNERADNPYSDAYGIPQALPGSKMASAGSNWQTSATTQIAWGLGYIKARYGDPCDAWAFWQSHHWY